MVLQPLRLRPCYKSYMWGGTRLQLEFGKTDAPKITAESWELADNPDGYSIVSEGPLAGKKLSDLSKMNHHAYWGSSCKNEEFPILVKLIDTAKDLSIQVHPSEDNALTSCGERGKAEMWYVVDALPGSYIYYGFSRQICPKEFEDRVRNGSITDVLNRISVDKGDIFYISPGTIHSIGAGILMAEIQQNSNTTIRIFDYMRLDKSGNPRPLNLIRAMQTVNYEPMIPSNCEFNDARIFPGYSIKELSCCAFFHACCLDVHTSIPLHSDGTSFHHLLCVEGKGEILSGNICYPLKKGDSFFIPALLGDYQIKGLCRVLLSKV